MSQVISKSSSFLLVLALLSVMALPCINACPTCAPTHKPPPPPPAPKPTTPCPPPPAAPSAARCPRDALKLGVCADVLGLVHAVVGGLGAPSSGSKCCALLNGLTDLEAAVCLCTAIKANVLGIKLDIPVALSVLLNACQKDVPSKFTCK